MHDDCNQSCWLWSKDLSELLHLVAEADGPWALPRRGDDVDDALKIWGFDVRAAGQRNPGQQTEVGVHYYHCVLTERMAVTLFHLIADDFLTSPSGQICGDIMAVCPDSNLGVNRSRGPSLGSPDRSNVTAVQGERGPRRGGPCEHQRG